MGVQRCLLLGKLFYILLKPFIMKNLSFEQMEEVNGGISGECAFAIRMSVVSLAGMTLSAGTIVGAAIGVTSWYGSIIGISLSCSE